MFPARPHASIADSKPSSTAIVTYMYIHVCIPPSLRYRDRYMREILRLYTSITFRDCDIVFDFNIEKRQSNARRNDGLQKDAICLQKMRSEWFYSKKKKRNKCKILKKAL